MLNQLILRYIESMLLQITSEALESNIKVFILAFAGPFY